MIKHIVMFKLQAGTTPEAKEPIKHELQRRLMELPSKISTILKFEVGLNVKESDRSYDVVLVSEFPDLDGLNHYAIHPAHLEVVGYIRTVCDKPAAVDYEF